MTVSCGNIYIFPFLVLNKFKRRKFLKTKNLLTGETEADPEMIKVRFLVLFFFIIRSFHKLKTRHRPV